ncbi:MAG: hypothetical protein RL033_6528 [Pseudomonadota bacterium]
MPEPLAPRPRPQLRVLTGGAPEVEPGYSDAELFECISRGEERAASSLYRKLLPEMELALLAVLERRDVRRDALVQTSFERMIARISRRRYAEACSLKTWASAVSAQVALQALRVEQRRQRRSARGRRGATQLSAVPTSNVPASVAPSSIASTSIAPSSIAPSSIAPSSIAPGPTSERSSFTSRGVIALRDCVSRSSAAHAEMVVLHDLLGLPTAEIATLMRLSLSATQSRLARAHKELTLALLAEGWLAEAPQSSPPARGRARPVPDKAPDLEDLFSAWRAESRAHSRASSIGRGGSRAVAHALQLVARRRRRARRLNTLGLLTVALLTLAGVAFGIWFAQRRLSGEAERAVVEPRVLLGGVLGDVSVSDRDGHATHGFASLGEGYALRTDDGRARLGFSSGAAVSVAQHSRLVLLSAQDTEVFYLGSGTAEIDLPDLALGGSFAVETPDTHVTSHAAQFVVGVEPEMGGASPTRVTVRTGTVSLRSGGRQIELEAGQSWPAALPSAAGTEELEEQGAPGLDLTLPELAPRGPAPADFTGE